MKCKFKQRIAIFKEKLQAMIQYAGSKDQCRSNMLLAYFGEVREDRCGICDFCVGRNKLDINEIEYADLLEKTKHFFSEKAHTVEFALASIPYKNKNMLLTFIKWMIDYDFIVKTTENKFIWNAKK